MHKSSEWTLEKYFPSLKILHPIGVLVKALNSLII